MSSAIVYTYQIAVLMKLFLPLGFKNLALEGFIKVTSQNNSLCVLGFYSLRVYGLKIVQVSSCCSCMYVCSRCKVPMAMESCAVFLFADFVDICV